MENTLLSLLQGSTISKRYEFGETSFELRTLVQEEKEEIVNRVFALNIAAQEELWKKPILGHALTKVSDAPIMGFPAIKELKLKNPESASKLIVELWLNKANTTLVSALYALYVKLEEDELKKYEQLKKYLVDHSEE